MNSSVFDLQLSGVALISRAHAESLKWVACAVMLAEHFARYVLGGAPDWLYASGRIVFPAFMLALGAGLTRDASPDRLRRVLGRLLGWTLVAAVSAALVRELVPINALGTIALSVLLWIAARQRVWSVAIALLVAGLPFEFGPFGVLAGALFLQVGSGRAPWWMLAAGLASCSFATLHWGPALVLVVVALVQGLDVRAPRIRHAFYWVYSLQFPAFWLLARVAS